MENATKALLIAAAVLIAIILIALGVRLINSGSDITGQADTTSQTAEVQAFNAQFTAYEGRIKGTAVRNLISAINISNNNNSDHFVDFEDLDSPEDAKPNKEYNVDFSYDGDGYIRWCNIYE